MMLVISPKSMRVISTPLMEWFREFLCEAIGEDKAEDVIRFSYRFSSEMDEEPESDFDRQLASFF